MKIFRLGSLSVGIAAFIVSLILSPGAFGQGVTTASITGTVVDKQGQPVAGAVVTALLSDSGTKATAVSRANGEYTLIGLHPGGPYTLTASSKGMTSEEKAGIFLEVGAQYAGKDTILTLSSEVVQMEAVSVESGRDTTFNAGQMSNAMNLGSADIVNITSIRQDIQDIQNLDPRAVVMQVGTTDSQYTVSFAGQNPRENLLLIDGVSANDNFGLNSNGYAGFRNPLPLPWIQSMSIDLNPYDLIYSGFSGGVTNATLKDGTNTFHGSVYEMYTGTNFRGPDPVVGALGAHEPMNEHTTGLSLGGPIIKNKLFFFLGYEAFRELAVPPAQNFLPDDSTGTIDQIVVEGGVVRVQPGNADRPESRLEPELCRQAGLEHQRLPEVRVHLPSHGRLCARLLQLHGILLHVPQQLLVRHAPHGPVLHGQAEQRLEPVHPELPHRDRGHVHALQRHGPAGRRRFSGG